MSTPTLTILIVNYNGRRFLSDCLDSIHERVSTDHEIIVVDNASQDGSVELLRTRYPEVRLIESATNLGFASANNLGAANSHGKYILLLNSDTILLSDVSSAIQLLESKFEVGMVGAKMLNGDREWQPSTGRFPTPARLLKFSTMLHDVSYLSKATKSRPFCIVDWAQGSFLLVSAETYRAVGGFDKGYFMYVEDVDLCRRIFDLGLKVVFMPEVEYIHFGGFNSKRWQMLYEGFQRYHRKFSSPAVRFAAWSILRLGRAARIALYGDSVRPTQP